MFIDCDDSIHSCIQNAPQAVFIFNVSGDGGAGEKGNSNNDPNPQKQRKEMDLKCLPDLVLQI